MKKQLIQLIPVLIFLFAASLTTAQSGIDNTVASLASNLGTNNILKLELTKKSNTKSVTIPQKYQMISVDESAFSFKVSPDFGSYVIPNTNYLKIVASDGNIYTNAKMIDKASGKFIFDLEIESDKKVIDMSNTRPGVYKLTLSNKKGQKYTEDIMIM